MAKNYFTVGQEYLQFLSGDELTTEITRQTTFRASLGPDLASLKAGLLGKKPQRVAGAAQTTIVPPAGTEGTALPVLSAQPVIKSKFKMAAMSIPKFSGKIVDYPEWWTLFKDCVEAQYEESSVVMLLRTEALP